MRILAIRLCNLTSFAGAFELDLARPPLSGSGVFSITGRTGAGKSTLLDAMCLALFATAPRLDGVASRVGRADEEEDERLFTSDSRQLVRRGTSHGWAEVDYVGKDGRRYQARWSARRARGSTRGRFQDAVRELRDLDDDTVVAAGKTEVADAVQRTLGLTFDQFRRSALLAQGDFAAFLVCKADNRADLLEQMTGTEMYTEISKAAFARAKQAREELRVLDAQREAVRVLDDDARAELDAKIAALTTVRDVAKGRVAALEAAVAWYDDAAKLAAAQARTKGALAQAERHVLEIAPLRAELDEVRKARALASFFDAEREPREKLATAEPALATARAAATEAAKVLEHAKEALVAAERGLADAEARLESVKPELQAAEALDTVIDEKRNQCDDARGRAQKSAGAHAEARGQLGDAEAALADATVRTNERRGWLDAHAADAPLADQWDRWREQIVRFAGAKQAGERAAGERRTAEAVVTAACAALEKLRAERADADRDREQAQSAYETAGDAARGARLSDEQRAERDEVARQKGIASTLAMIVERARNAEQKRESLRELVESARAEAARETEVASRADGDAAIADAKLVEAQRALERTRAALGLDDHRAGLRDGEPCPLCGATEHPYADRAPVAGLAEEQKRRVAELDAVLRALRTAAEGSRAIADARANEAERADADASDAQRDVERARADWDKQTRDLGLDAPHPDARGLEAATALADRLAARAEELRALETLAAKLAEKSEQARKRSDAAAARAATAVEAESTAERACATAKNDVNLATERAETARADGAKALEALAVVLVARDGSVARLEADPAAFESECATTVRSTLDQRALLAKAEEDHATAARACETLAATVLERERAAREDGGSLAASERDLAERIERRATMLAGRKTSEVRTELETARAKAAEQTVARRGDEEKARTHLATSRTAAATAEQAAIALREEAERAKQRLDEAVTATGIDPAHLAERRSRDDAWIEATAAAISGADRDVDTACVLATDADTKRATHDASPRPDIDEAAARDELPRARATVEAVHNDVVAAVERVKVDDEGRDARAKLGDALAKAEAAAERWRILDTLIGASDGKKLRTFAQGLTLDSLIALANVHLRDLAPRYELMRAPGQDMDLQVIDKDMADEIRGTNSLSGGETFLVSLALALALASLASRDVRIETLFVDEGFGTLDPNALDAVLAALDSLQATGRQIGVISHVGALADKIGSQVQVRRVGAGRSMLVVGGVEQRGDDIAEQTAAETAAKPKTKRARKVASA